MRRFSEQIVQQKWACPMSENPALSREDMDIRFVNVLLYMIIYYVIIMWKLHAKTQLHPL